MARYWIGTVSKEHVMRGVSLGIAQVGHGKRAGLARMKKGDVLIYYSPKQSYEGDEPLQAFTAVATMLDDNVYQVEESPSFKPFRRDVSYDKNFTDVPIRPLIEKLEFIEDPKRWGYKFRFGIFEISEKDFLTITKNK